MKLASTLAAMTLVAAPANAMLMRYTANFESVYNYGYDFGFGLPGDPPVKKVRFSFVLDRDFNQTKQYAPTVTSYWVNSDLASFHPAKVEAIDRFNGQANSLLIGDNSSDCPVNCVTTRIPDFFVSVFGNSAMLHYSYQGALFRDLSGRMTSQVVAVPEPASWAMILVGFGLTGASMRRQRRGRDERVVDIVGHA